MAPNSPQAAMSPASTQEKKPNILFILADNLGYGDSVYGGETVWRLDAAHRSARHRESPG